MTQPVHACVQPLVLLVVWVMVVVVAWVPEGLAAAAVVVALRVLGAELLA